MALQINRFTELKAGQQCTNPNGHTLQKVNTDRSMLIRKEHTNLPGVALWQCNHCERFTAAT